MPNSLSTEHEALLKSVYYTQAVLVGRDRLYSYLAKMYPEDHPSRRQVMNWLKDQKIWQLHTRPPARLPTKSVTVSKPMKYFQIDLTGPLIRDKGFHYILGIIDVHTKLLHTAPLKNKSSFQVANALEKIINEHCLNISVIQSDNGLEFTGSEFQQLLREKGIKHITSKPHSPWTNGCIERVWGILKQMLYKYQTAVGDERWVNILPILTKNYNRTLHRTIAASPEEAGNLPSGVVALRLKAAALQQQQPTKNEKSLQAGDKVRLRLDRVNLLEKSKQYYSDEIYTISRVIRKKSDCRYQYTITDSRNNNVKGTFNSTDILKIENSQEPSNIHPGQPLTTNRRKRNQDPDTANLRLKHRDQRELDELNRIAKPSSSVRQRLPWHEN